MKIVLFNLKYSDNLGDEIIASCLENVLTNQTRQPVRSLDLSGRTKRGGIPYRATTLATLRSLPPFVRRMIVRISLRPLLRRMTKYWIVQLQGADLAVIGGGHLFQDNDLNFPLKIAAAAKAARLADVPLAIYGVGVSELWSKSASHLCRSLSRNELVFVAVRDEESRQSFLRHFAGLNLPEVHLCRDPALLATATSSLQASPSRTIGIGVVHPHLLDYHANMPVVGATGDPVAFYLDVAQLLLYDGFDVVFFSNGATEDELFMESLKRKQRQFASIGDRVRFAPRPANSAQLLDLIDSLEGLIAHRLHANICAFALAKPHVGLAWDKKVSGFFHSVGRDRYILTDPATSPAQIVARLKESLADRFDDEYRRVVAAADADIRAFVATAETYLTSSTSTGNSQNGRTTGPQEKTVRS